MFFIEINLSKKVLIKYVLFVISWWSYWFPEGGVGHWYNVKRYVLQTAMLPLLLCSCRWWYLYCFMFMINILFLYFRLLAQTTLRLVFNVFLSTQQKYHLRKKNLYGLMSALKVLFLMLQWKKFLLYKLLGSKP